MLKFSSSLDKSAGVKSEPGVASSLYSSHYHRLLHSTSTSGSMASATSDVMANQDLSSAGSASGLPHLTPAPFATSSNHHLSSATSLGLDQSHQVYGASAEEFKYPSHSQHHHPYGASLGNQTPPAASASAGMASASAGHHGYLGTNFPYHPGLPDHHKLNLQAS